MSSEQVIADWRAVSDAVAYAPEDIRDAARLAVCRLRNAEMASILSGDELTYRGRAEKAQSRLTALLDGIEGLADDFRGCGDHSRHKQAAEAWHYCANKLRTLRESSVPAIGDA